MAQQTGFIRASATNIAEAEVLNATTGLAFVGTVTVFVTVDTNAQVQGTVGGGIATAKGNGQYQYIPSAAESDGTKCTFLFTGSGAIPSPAQYWTISAGQSSAVSIATTASTRTVADLIVASLKRINAVGAAGEISPEDMEDAFQRLVSLMESYQLDGLSIPYTVRTVWDLTSSKGILGNPYTVGTGGDVNVLRPSLPDSLDVRFQDPTVTPTIEYRMNMLTDDAWALVPQKNLTSPLPTSWYYQPTYASGFGSLYFWFVPTNSNLQGVMYSPAQIAAFVAKTDSVILPPGYYRMLRDNLALELSPEWDYNAQADPALIKSALESMALVRRANYRPADMAVDPALTRFGRRYSIYSDGPW